MKSSYTFQQLIVTFLALCSLTFVGVIDIVSDEVAEVSAAKLAEVQQEALRVNLDNEAKFQKIKNQRREIASVNSEIRIKPDKIVTSPSEVKQIALDCEKELNQPQIVEQTSYIQIKILHCFKSQEISIINQTNGFMATIFEAKPGLYQTDLIKLAHGANAIVVEIQNKNGSKKNRSIQINREKNQTLNQ